MEKIDTSKGLFLDELVILRSKKQKFFIEVSKSEGSFTHTYLTDEDALKLANYILQSINK